MTDSGGDYRWRDAPALKLRLDVQKPFDATHQLCFSRRRRLERLHVAGLRE